MALPLPQPGQVIRYAHLWWNEARTGREDGVKDRPCSIVLTRITTEGRTVAYVLPVTHTPPEDAALAVEIPAGTKARLGLDGERSWIILNEANRFIWPGPDLRPIPGDATGRVDYGLLPSALYDLVRTKWLAAYDRQQVGQLNRTD